MKKIGKRDFKTGIIVLLVLLTISLSSCITYFGDGEIVIGIPTIKIVKAIDWDSVEGVWFFEHKGPDKRVFLGEYKTWFGQSYRLYKYRDWRVQYGTKEGYVFTAEEGWVFKKQTGEWWSYVWKEERINSKSISNNGSGWGK